MSEKTKNFTITTDNFREVYKELMGDVSSELTRESLEGREYSEKSFYHTLSSHFRTRYVSATQEKLIEYMRSEECSSEDAKIIKEIILYSNIPMAIKTVDSFLHDGSRERKMGMENFDEGDIMAQGIVIITNSINTYSSTHKGTYKLQIERVTLVDGDKPQVVLHIKGKTTVNSTSLEINGTVYTFDIVNNTVSIDLDFFSQEQQLSIIDDVSSLKVLKLDQTETSEEVTTIGAEPTIIIQNKFVKFITFLTHNIRNHIQQYVLKQSGVKLPTAVSVLLNKANWGVALYKRLVEKNKMKFYSDDIKDKLELQDTEQVEISTISVSSDPYYDDYYTQIQKKEVILDESSKIPTTPSDRWVAIFLYTQEERYNLVMMDDVYDISFTGEKYDRKSKESERIKEELYSINIENLTFTASTEKSIQKILEQYTKAKLKEQEYNLLSLSTSIGGDDEEATIEDVTSDENSGYKTTLATVDWNIIRENLVKYVHEHLQAEYISPEIAQGVIVYVDSELELSVLKDFFWEEIYPKQVPVDETKSKEQVEKDLKRREVNYIQKVNEELNFIKKLLSVKIKSFEVKSGIKLDEETKK